MIKKVITAKGERWRVRVFGERTPSGDRPTLSATTDRRAEAVMIETRFRMELQSGPRHIEQRTLGEYLTVWQTGRKMSVAATTWERHNDFINLAIKHIGAIKMTKLRAADLTAFYADLLSNGRVKGEGGLSPQTIHHVHRCISKALADAVAEDLLPKNPAAYAKRPQVEEREMNLPTPAELSAVLGKIQTSRAWPLVALALATGARRGELIGLKWSDIDFDAGTLSISRAVVRVNRKSIVKQPKSRKGRRVIALPRSVLPILRQWQADQRLEMLRHGFRNPDEWVLTSLKGEMLVPDTLSSAVRAAANAVGVNVHLHQFRHLQASQLMGAGINPKVAQERLGHSRVSTTLAIYSHTSREMDDVAALAVDGLFDTMK